MHIQYIKPSGFLAQYIRHYWILETDAHDIDVCERVIPTGNIEWLFHYRNTFEIKNSEKTVYQPRSFVSGISSNYCDIATRGESGVFVVTFYPHGASHFLKFPLSEIEDAIVDLRDIFYAKSREVEELICSVNSHEERTAIIENFLIYCFTSIKENDLLLIKKAVEIINLYKGQINSSDLSERLSCSKKTLERKFSSLLGKTPKQFIRIVRFQGIIQGLSSGKDRNLTQFACDNGYFDQAHFIKDFKCLSGYTPKEFLSLGPCHADYFE